MVLSYFPNFSRVLLEASGETTLGNPLLKEFDFIYSMEWFDGEEWHVEQLQFDHSYSTTAVLPCQ